MAGVRSGKTVTTIDTSTGEITGTTEYKYTTLSGKLVRVEYNTTILDIVYDESGQPFSIRYKSSPTATGALYYYVLNAQGDVVGLLNSSGELVVEYKYDPWGKLLETIIGVDETDSKYAAYNNMGLRNPLRYRGYIYDRDTGLYYLQSRYYDPEIGRFINADGYVTTDVLGLLSSNMFAYCENNPINMSDPTGHGGIGLMSDWNPQEFHKNNKPQEDFEDVIVDALIYSIEAHAGIGMGIQAEFKCLDLGVSAGFSGNLIEGYFENGKAGLRQSIRYGVVLDLGSYLVGGEGSYYQDMNWNELKSPENWIIITENLHYTTIVSASLYVMYGGCIEVGINWDKFAEYLSTHAARIG